VAQCAFIARSAIRRSCAVIPSVASQTTSATSARSAGPLGAQRGVVLDVLGDLGLAAHARGVDEDHVAVGVAQRQVDRVAGRARDVGDDDALLAEDPVDQRGLADVRAPDDRQAHEALLLGLLVALGQQRDGASSRSPELRPCAALTAIGSPRPRPWNSAASARSRTSSTLLAATTTGLSQRRSRSASSWSPGACRLGVDDEDRDVGVVERGLDLLDDRPGHRVLVGEVHAAGVDEDEVRPFHSQASSLRSRVTPARSCTTASRLPLRRLTSEDLPTFG
jgi:hypothetical protein